MLAVSRYRKNVYKNKQNNRFHIFKYKVVTDQAGLVPDLFAGLLFVEKIR